MAIYTTRWFDRWARKQGPTAPLLSKAQRAGELMEVNCDAQD